MPDLKSELQKLADLKFDDDGDTMTETTAPSLGVSETFFNIIRDNPGLTRAELLVLARKAGIKDASSSSLVVQFVKRGIIRPQSVGNVSSYFTIGKSYTSGYIRREKPVAKATPKPAPVPDNPVRVIGTVPELLNALSIVQARELYDALKKIFGA
jgi:hypothetical protein